MSSKGKPRFLTIEQVAEEINVGLPVVRGLLRTGELRGIQIGGRGLWRIGANDLDDYIAQAYRIAGERVAAGDVEALTEEPDSPTEGDNKDDANRT